MKEIDVSGLSIPALTALVTIHATGSLSRAAEQLGLTQSTLSHTLKRLRAAFGDELFLRQGRGIMPTIRCDEIVRGVDPLLSQLAVLARPAIFEPGTTTLTFTISCNFYERAVLLPALLGRFRTEAPSARLRIIQADLRGHEQLREGLCDLLISPLPAETAGLYRRRLLRDRYVCFLDPSHPLAAGPLTLDAYAAADHIAVSYGGGWRPFYRAALEALGIEITPRVELPSFGAIGSVLQRSDLILTAPSALAPVVMPEARMLEPPFSAGFEIYAFWSARQHHSDANQWLRGLVAAAARQRGRASAD